jgi:alcohol dehydrogenase, propanol-preferring
MALAEENIPPRMLAAQLVKHESAPVVQEARTPDPNQLGPHDLLLRTGVASLCHTDLMVQAGFMPALNGLPLTMSHEGTGTVVARGSAVKGFQLGDRVMSGITFHPCGKCEACNPPPGKDWAQYCFSNGGATGITSDGAFAEYHVVDARTSCKCPDEVPFLTAAPLACAGVTVYRAVKIASETVSPDGWLAIVGAGMLNGPPTAAQRQ